MKKFLKIVSLAVLFLIALAVYFLMRSQELLAPLEVPEVIGPKTEPKISPPQGPPPS